MLWAYVHDAANEGPNRQMQNPNLSSMHLMKLCTILGCINPYVNVFVHVANCLVTNPVEEVHICIKVDCTPGNGDVHRYNVLTINKVTMIIFGEPGEVGNRDIIVQ